MQQSRCSENMKFRIYNSSNWVAPAVLRSFTKQTVWEGVSFYQVDFWELPTFIEFAHSNLQIVIMYGKIFFHISKAF